MDAAELASVFGLGRARGLSDGPVARGRQGEVWRLDTSDGRWAVKVPFHEAGEGGALFQEAACAAGVPAPAIRRTVTGEVVAHISGRQIRLYEWVELGTPDPMVDPGLVGATVAAVHRVVVPASGPVEWWHTAPVGAPAWDQLIARLRAAGAPFAARLAELRDELVALESWLTPPVSVRMCHRDLWADNVLPTPSGGLCVIDWENSGPADPAQELACVVFEFARTDPGRVRDLMSAYESAGGPARLTRPGDFSMLIAQLGHITELAANDWLTPNVRNPDRAGAEAWIGETLDEPHTRAVLQSLLRATRPQGL
ncbi:phosphotransferase enzyme family protein [Paractinoplanes deccanensis]|uniref:phosphotransferase enzyme family protein n=1 Tax=Paractinoplanes deccanensis TaxID=113561 RepID=UPI001940EC62|nr:phosphotransferase [Actinoplanes deccanensis]